MTNITAFYIINAMIEISKKYSPKDFEKKIYQKWEDKGAFKSQPNKKKKPFTIVMPPPNITGKLHMGHALDQTLQDMLIRIKRMMGYEALWLPGTDHASIATELKVLSEIKEKEGLTKDEIGRDEFLKRAWEWKDKYGGEIVNQMRKMGNSCDWDKLRFTMDEGLSKAVEELFIRYYNDGLIYRGKRMINWCPVCGSALSDIEVEHEDIEGSYWYFRYFSKDKSFHIDIATSRPETMFGDTAIAVHPSDKRYKSLIGKSVLIPVINKEIKIIEDIYPDPEKGTGAVKITPAHDFNDFEVGERNNLEIVEIMNEDGTLNDNAFAYSGMDRYEARKKWVEELEKNGHLVKIEKINIPVGKCYRCSEITEPLLSEQWFVKMESLAKGALDLVKTKKTYYGSSSVKKELSFVPKRFENTYSRWLSEIKDWCISRQLWWGHRIPVYYCKECDEMVVSKDPQKKCPKCGGEMFQDPDVLDTWFSSALWPFSTLGWPDKSEELEYYYPTNVLVTGYDIIFFWVVRMAFSSKYVMGNSPFEKVLIHGLVRAEDGRKMSKSLGNGVDPLEIIENFGADALRYMLIDGTAGGNDMRFSMEKIEFARNFANKLWNATRFILMSCDELSICENFESAKLSNVDKWILNELNETIKEINRHFEDFDFSVATSKIYNLLRFNFCDWYIEFSKENKNEQVLIYSLVQMLKLLHPIMPFITEEIYSYICKDELLMLSSFPTFRDDLVFEKEANEVNDVKEIIKEIRNIRAVNNVELNKELNVYIKTDLDLRVYDGLIKLLTKAKDLIYVDEDIEDTVMSVVNSHVIFIKMDEMVDKEKELEKLEKEEENLLKIIQARKAKLSNTEFTSKAPQKVVDIEKEKLASEEDSLSKIIARKNALL